MEKKCDNKLLERIQKLFQLGTSSNLHEAAAAIKKAEALMEEYGLTFGEVNYVTEFVERKGRKINSWEMIIFAAVCFANNCVPAVNTNRFWGAYSLAGRKINVFLSVEMFRYLTEAVSRSAKAECKGRGHKYSHDFKMAAADTLRARLLEYGSRVSWAVDRDEEVKNIREFRRLKDVKKPIGHGFGFRAKDAIYAGIRAGQNIGLHKQAGIEETRLIGALT